MREGLVSELVKELLGPRLGHDELLSVDPLSEYMTGVLAPTSRLVFPRDADADAEIPVDEASESAEEDATEADVAPPIFAPVLDPKNRPHSMGLSFVIRSEQKKPSFDVCLSWARYLEEEGGWRRCPRAALLPVSEAKLVWVNSKGDPVDNEEESEISFHVLIHTMSARKFLITLYLVNRLRPTEQFLTAHDHIFQPSIRVSCSSQNKIVPGVEGSPHTEEEKTLQFLYRRRPVLARGHLCSAVWRQVDPEAVDGDAPHFPDSLKLPPFRWPDGGLFKEPDQKRFSPPDVRTEYVPIALLQAPDFDWESEFGPPPELRAEALAESWEPSRLQASLGPVVQGYRTWIKHLRRDNTILPTQRAVAEHLIKACEAAAARIEQGIEVLLRDEDVRLSFCFAMKTISIQFSWPTPGSKSFSWRPFQLAFLLMTLESAINDTSTHRSTCDLLWVSTGGGKTETYLALACLVAAHRRRRALRRRGGERTGAGLSVISRYTLRLLTIQQFRRACKVVTAMELLRVSGLGSGNPVGWRPKAYSQRSDYIWGSSRFSVGLWVGGNVTPNRIQDGWSGKERLVGAISILKGEQGDAEPAQILNCPACDTILSFPQRRDGGLPSGNYSLHLVVRVFSEMRLQADRLSEGIFTVTAARLNRLRNRNFGALSIEFSTTERIAAEDVDEWWKSCTNALPGLDLACARASRPGYFIRPYSAGKGKTLEYDFDLFCPNPECHLLSSWSEGIPSGWRFGVATPAAEPRRAGKVLALPDGNHYACVNDAFRTESQFVADRVPIPAVTVDEQVYNRCPSLLVATVDKFARPAFEPRASALFGNVSFHHNIWGYYRLHEHGAQDASGHPSPAGVGANKNWLPVSQLGPPDLILQDELHLIEGPLGSLMGFYESAFDYLAKEPSGRPVKYIASSATVRQAEEQVKAVFARGLQLFPPPGLTNDQRFFVRFSRTGILDDQHRGQLYVGICAPGKGPLTPLVRIWSCLLQAAWNYRNHLTIDPFWTLTGYFNALRELAGARALYRQDIPERLSSTAGAAARPLPEDRCQELSGRTPSTELPFVLDMMNVSGPQAPDAVFTTSMFGTGVDVPRLGLMVVNGQPKTTSAYIQATGRVGRSRGALVVTFLRASRPRDLNHYEFFCGYHEQLHRFVEPITVMPFAPGVLERAAGPLGVLTLRNKRNTAVNWYLDQSAVQMAQNRAIDPDIRSFQRAVEDRAQSQPDFRKPPLGYVERLTNTGFDHWQQIASQNQNLEYVEYAITNPPTVPVVLGDPQHDHAGFEIVYKNAPQSLRDIEETCGFQT